MQLFKRINWIPALLCGILLPFFVTLFYQDNKYQTPPPYGRDGILEIKESDLDDAPIFLIDGWLLTDSYDTNLPTYVGEHSNLRRNRSGASPHGAASYQLTLRYSGKPLTVVIDFPKLANDYRVLLNGVEITRGSGNARAVFSLKKGDQTVTVHTTSDGGYYSGIYFPPALGTPEVIHRIQGIQSFAYALAFLAPLVLAIFTFALWRRRSDLTAFWFGLLCCFYALYVAHYFVYQFHLPLIPHWNIAEEFAIYGLIFCVIRLTALAADVTIGKIFRLIQLTLLVLPLLLLALYLYIPVWTDAVVWHGVVKNFYFIFTFSAVLFLATSAAMRRSSEHRYILAGCMVFGAGLLLNLFCSNHFEPILFFWQIEWCGLFLVVLFGGMMTARNRRILEENAAFSHQLEQLVEKRTQELSALLAERKAFFSDMAHDLKAPIFATQAFIGAIRRNKTGVDGELLRYIDAVEQKQQEMARRVQGLGAINQLDKIAGDKESISIKSLLDELYATHNGEAEVSSIHLLITSPETDCCIMAQPEKLYILFENLIYNAINATPAEGHIVLSVTTQGEQVHFVLSDTGCGIPENELPHIFTRFYVGERSKGSGTGLGLYIVKSIVAELGGEISAVSQVGKGTQFTITVPLA